MSAFELRIYRRVGETRTLLVSTLYGVVAPPALTVRPDGDGLMHLFADSWMPGMHLIFAEGQRIEIEVVRHLDETER